MMSEQVCPSCGREFDSRRGLGVHHSLVHDEQLPNRECGRCGTDFHSEYEKRYCSDECRDSAVSFSGEDNPNYRGGKEVTECAICEDEFEYYPSDKEGVYCPDCVETADWRDLPNIEGEDNPRWNGGKIQFECAVCGSNIERYPGNVTGEGQVCSDSCQRTWISEKFTGKGHPNWAGGTTGPYGKGWNDVRNRALERDGYKCQCCGKTKEDIGRNPDVHHIVPVRLFEAAEGYDKTDAHFLENVISLCVNCHRQADFGRISRSTLREMQPKCQ